MEEKQMKLDELFEDDAFVDAVCAADSSEEAQKLFAEKGLELTLEEVESLGQSIGKAALSENGELSEEDLDSVAGGLRLVIRIRRRFYVSRRRYGRWIIIRR